MRNINQRYVEETYDDEGLLKTIKYRWPDNFNFGYDVVDAWAKKDRNRLAMIWVDKKGNEKKFTFRDMMNLSNQAANILLKYGINKGDRVLILLPRIPEWWIFVVALIKLGAVYCPCPSLLTPKDLQYRINVGHFKMVITNLENSWKIEEICKDCPSLQVRFLVDGELEGIVTKTDILDLIVEIEGVF